MHRGTPADTYRSKEKTNEMKRVITTHLLPLLAAVLLVALSARPAATATEPPTSDSECTAGTFECPRTARLVVYHVIEELGIVTSEELDVCELEDTYTVPVTVFDPAVGFTVHTEMTVCDYGRCGTVGVIQTGGTWHQ